MGNYSIRTNEEIDYYLSRIVKTGLAKKEGEAIKLIIFERMLADAKKGEISPFEYRPARKKRCASKKLRIEIIGKEAAAPVLRPAASPQLPAETKKAETIEETKDPAAAAADIQKKPLFSQPSKVDCSKMSAEE